MPVFKKTRHASGFTIIEVVITIAIGAAVMALVLNAVAGARRSQRNNARSADVNQIAAGINQYIATRNRLPGTWVEISSLVGSGFGHYDATYTPGTGSCSDSTMATSGTCVGNWDHDTDPLTADIPRVWTAIASASKSVNPQYSWSATDPSSGGVFPTANITGTPPVVTPPTIPNTVLGGSDPSAADKVVVWLQGACNGFQLEQGGIREVAIFYRLEGQDDPLCIEV